MPVHDGEDDSGPYYQWGNHGKKYYYKKNSAVSENNARKKAGEQGRAAHANGYRGAGGSELTYGQSWVNF
jgi:hypothetical protein